MDDCVFCKIVAGTLPCQKLYEDAPGPGSGAGAMAFLDIGPVARGHVLVIPKAHALTLDELSPEAGAALGAALVKVGGAVARATGAPAWNVLQNNGKLAGQVVPHVHFHIIPRYGNDAFTFTWPAAPLKEQDAADLSAKIVAALK